jgi:CRP-like cAMP-binding protein
MEDQVSATGYAPDDGHVTSGATSQSTSTSKRCSLPLGLPRMCGDARYREDREPDREVIAGGAPSQDVWFIRSGILRLQRYAYDGRRQILSLFLPGEIVGFEGEFREGATVETVTQSGLCRINRRRFETMLTENDELRAELFRQKQEQLDRLHWLTWSIGVLNPEERFCAFLALSARFMPYQPLSDGTAILSMQLPRVDIADLLGTTVETICRVNRKLSENGVIEIKDPSHYRILDQKRLTSIGQIDGSFDRMISGIGERRKRLDIVAGSAINSPVCFCGR